MIRNGLYLASTKMLDDMDAEKRGVMILHDGTMLGGGAFFYTSQVTPASVTEGGRVKSQVESTHLSSQRTHGRVRSLRSDFRVPIQMTEPKSTVCRSLASEVSEYKWPSDF